MAFDGVVTKKVVEELQSIVNYKVDKIYQPDKNTIIIGLYGNFKNMMLLSCISSNNYRIHLTRKSIKNPDIAPNFCMLLRKHILGYKITSIYTNSLERIVYIEFQSPEENKVTKKTLIVELMGKHSNIILEDERGIVIDALRHTTIEENAQRDIYPSARYFKPKVIKNNLLEVKNFEDFYNKLNLLDNDDALKNIVDKFNGIGFSNLKALMDEENIKKNTYTSQKLIARNIYNKITEILNGKNTSIKIISKKNDVPNDYCLVINNSQEQNCLNFSLDDFYYEKEKNEIYKNFKNTLLNIILVTLKKYEKRIENIDEKLLECKNMDKYKLYGELITANLYKIPNYNRDKIVLENYYDENKLIEIKLDKKYSPQYNAKRYYKKYSKLKNASDVVGKQKEETKNEIKYIESIIYEIDNCKNMEELQEIYSEIIENDIFKSIISRKKIVEKKKNKKTKKMTSNKYANFNPIKYNIDGYTIYVGRNNKENDYLTNKFAGKNDIWFHTKDIHGSHVILKSISNGNKTENWKDFIENTNSEIIEKAAKLAAMHSKAKKSSNVPVDYCLVKFVKKVPGNKPGLVIYSNNKTIYV